ncbi:hypothetical protein TWF718_009846 [Orbilia javanica]|uniref:F-box domain-containing protein n=1 Tax=Orbilia javanica TaxID=47235 RepID=A0AAN8RFB7_9PEZI
MHKDILGLAPLDIQIGIFSYVEDYRNLIEWARVSRSWKELILSPSLEPVYRQLVLENWPKEYKLVSRKTLSTGSQALSFREILITLGKNVADIKAGHLHEAGSIIALPHVGRVEFCYGGGYLAVFSIGKNSIAEQDVIYVYDASLLHSTGGDLVARKVQCFGQKVKHVAIADGYLAWMTQDQDEKSSVSIGFVDLITFAARSFTPTVQDLDFDTYASIINEGGTDSFTDESKGRSSHILRLTGSPELFRTNGLHVVFSSSFLTHFTIWEISTDGDTPIIGKTYSLDPDWNSFLHGIWTEAPTWKNHTSLSYYLSIDDEGDIYAVVNGHLEEKDCFYAYDRYISRYACTFDGRPYRTKWTAGIPPTRFSELSDTQSPYVAARFLGFPSAGQNLFAYSPANTKLEEEDRDLSREELLEGCLTRLPYIVVDKKQPRHDEEWERHYRADFLPGSRFSTRYEYDIRYLNPGAIYRFPTPEMLAAKSSNTRVIPILSPTCVVWQLQYDDEPAPMDGEEARNIRKVRIIGLKPTMLATAPTPSDDEGGENSDDKLVDAEAQKDENNDNKNKSLGDGSNAQIQKKYVFYQNNVPPPASICELMLDQALNRSIRWEGDDQYIVLRHYEPVPAPTGEESHALGFTTRFTLFRYGDAEKAPLSYQIYYHDE